MEKVYYFDNAATTFPKHENVYKAMDEANRDYAVNAGRGAYALAAKASEVINETRQQIMELTETENVAEVVLTASATLACNIIFGGIRWHKDQVVYVSPFEHNATMRSLYLYQKQYGFAITELALDEKKMELDKEKIKFQFLREKPDFVAMSHVSNVTGYILPIEEITALAKEYEAVVIVDGAQALGLVPVSLRKTPIDFYVFAGHKTLYGPFGTGGFICHSDYKLKPFLAGGTGSDSLNLEMPEEGTLAYEPGSPNIVAIAGLHASLQERMTYLKDDADYFLRKEKELTAYLIEQLKDIMEVTLYLPENCENHAGIVSFNVEGYQSGDVGMILDQDYHIAVRTGYECAPLIHKYLGSESYLGVVRASIGRFTTKEEIDVLVNAVREIAEG